MRHCHPDLDGPNYMMALAKGFIIIREATMKRIVNQFQGRLWIAGLIIILPCCWLPVSYMAIREVNRTICYNNLAGKMNVAPTYEAISSAMYAQVESVLLQGMERSQVIAVLEEIAPIATHEEGPTLSGGYAEMVMLKVCSFSSGDVLLLVFYSPANRLEEVRLLSNDD